MPNDEEEKQYIYKIFQTGSKILYNIQIKINNAF